MKINLFILLLIKKVSKRPDCEESASTFNQRFMKRPEIRMFKAK